MFRFENLKQLARQAKERDKLTIYRLALGGSLTTILAVLVGTLVFRRDDTNRKSTESAEPQYTKQQLIDQQLNAIRQGDLDTFRIDSEPIFDEELRPLEGLAGLRTVMLDAGGISNDGLRTLATLPDLVHLRVRASIITDEGLSYLSPCKKLRVLNLTNPRLTDQGILHLQQLPQLRQLRIGGDNVTELSYSISQLTTIRALHLINVPVTDEGLKAIASMPQLESLYLDGPQVTEAGWQWLFDHHPELHVHINQAHHDRDPQFHRHNSES